MQSQTHLLSHSLYFNKISILLSCSLYFEKGLVDVVIGEIAYRIYCDSSQTTPTLDQIGHSSMASACQHPLTRAHLKHPLCFPLPCLSLSLCEVRWGWPSCYCKLWMNSLCLFSFGWSSFISPFPTLSSTSSQYAFHSWWKTLILPSQWGEYWKTSYFYSRHTSLSRLFTVLNFLSASP